MSESLKFEFEFIVSEDLLDEYGHVNNAIILPYTKKQDGISLSKVNWEQIR